MPKVKTVRNHQCPAIGCASRVDSDKVACGPHWSALPMELKEQIAMAFDTNVPFDVEHIGADLWTLVTAAQQFWVRQEPVR